MEESLKELFWGDSKKTNKEISGGIVLETVSKRIPLEKMSKENSVENIFDGIPLKSSF